MYSAKQRASEPVSISSSATSQLGTSTPVRPASFIAASMSVGFMSAEPTIFSSFRLSVTVEWALIASTITTTPKTIRIAPETKPPILRAFAIFYLPLPVAVRTIMNDALIDCAQRSEASHLVVSLSLRWGLLARVAVERLVQGCTVSRRNLCAVDGALQCPQREVRMNSKSMAGWIGFAGLVMLILGGINFFQGLIGVFEDDYYVVTQSGYLVFDVSAWGWILLVWGALLVLVGLGLLGAMGWARWFAIFLVSLNFFVQLGFLGNSNYPLWALTALALNVIVLFALTARWDESRAEFPTVR